MCTHSRALKHSNVRGSLLQTDPERKRHEFGLGHNQTARLVCVGSDEERSSIGDQSIVAGVHFGEMDAAVAADDVRVVLGKFLNPVVQVFLDAPFRSLT